MTECSQESFEFTAHFLRRVVAEFEGAWTSSDGGGVLLRQVERKLRLLPRVEACFCDQRDQERIEHSLQEMLAQRIYGLALGYELSTRNTARRACTTCSKEIFTRRQESS